MKSFIWLGLALVLLSGHAGAANNATAFVPMVSSGTCATWPTCPAVPNDATHPWYFAPSTTAGLATQNTLQALLDKLNAGVGVTGAFWQSTQPVSGTFWQSTQPVSGTFWQSTQPVSGTFWQATQPVSGTVTITPSGTQTVQGSGTAGTPAGGVETVQGATNGTPLNANLSSATPATASASGSITIQDTASTTTAGAFSVSYYAGTPTAGSTVSQALSGIALARVQVAGTFTGTVQIESSQDSGTTWRVSGGHVNGAVYSSATLTAPGSIVLGIGGATNIRVRAIAAMTGTVNVTMTFSNAQTAVEVINPVGIKDNVSGNQLVIGAGGTITTVPATTTPALTPTDISPSSNLTLVTGGASQTLIAANACPNFVTINNATIAAGQGIAAAESAWVKRTGGTVSMTGGGTSTEIAPGVTQSFLASTVIMTWTAPTTGHKINAWCE
jgi:hypothetical protein